MSTVAVLSGYYTVQEAAPIIGVSEPQVTRYCRNGILKAIFIGKQWLIEQADVHNFQRIPRGNPAFRERAKGNAKKSS